MTMDEKIVYLLGAGFSAPLGLPIMSDFLVKSKDMFFDDPVKYRQFEQVFKTIEELSIIKNFFSSDLFNIEEILSILEMERQLQGLRRTKTFTNYLSRVIEYYTPILEKPDSWPGNWWVHLFRSRNPIWTEYGYFGAALLGLEFSQKVNPDNKKLTPYFAIDKELVETYC